MPPHSQSPKDGREFAAPEFNSSSTMKEKTSSASYVIRFLRSPRQTIRNEKTLFKFMIVGASGTIVNLAVLYLLHQVVELVLAQAFGVEISIINNFIWNDSFTFKPSTTDDAKKRPGWFQRFVKYNTLSLGTTALNLSVFYLLAYPLGLRQGFFYLVSSFLAILAAFVFNYLGSSRWAWKGAGQEKKLGATDSSK